MSTETIALPVNESPKYDASDNSTNCCPRFHPAEWDERELHFEDKLFVKAKTKSVMHIPLNMGSVFKKTFEAIESAGAMDMEQSLVLSQDQSSWSAIHLFAVHKEVPGQEMVRLSGKFRTKVFEGPFSNIGKWCKQIRETGNIEHRDPETYFFYTTCPKCAKHYGKNYVVGFVEVE